MNKRFSGSVDTKLITKEKLVEKSFIKKDGVEVNQKNFLFDIVMTDEHKILASGDTWDLVSCGFITEQANKEEKADKKLMPIIGNVTKFVDKIAQPNFSKDSSGKEITVDESPF